MANVKVKVEIPGIEKVSELINRHYELLKELENNTSQVYAERLELEVKLNQPSEVEKQTEKKTQPDSSKEPVEIKRQKDSWQDLREMGIEIKNKSVVYDIVNLMLKSELNYLEANEALREADRALRHKALATT